MVKEQRVSMLKNAARSPRWHCEPLLWHPRANLLEPFTVLVPNPALTARLWHVLRVDLSIDSLSLKAVIIKIEFKNSIQEFFLLFNRGRLVLGSVPKEIKTNPKTLDCEDHRQGSKWVN